MRVADFGVARALAEAAWTEPAGAMVGTARYISPEAAEGKPVDGRADVYSLALVLYEAVTGVVPFVTDTTMGTLAARIGQPLPHNDLLGPLDDVLARAAAPDVASRLDAAGLAARLGALASALPTPSALPLIMPRLEDSAPINGFRAPGVSELTDSGLDFGAGRRRCRRGGGRPRGRRHGGGARADARRCSHRHEGRPGRALRRRANRWRLGVGRPVQTSSRQGAGERRARRSVPSAEELQEVVDRRGGGARPHSRGGPGHRPSRTNVFTPSHPTPALTSLSLAQARATADKVHMTLEEGKPVPSISVGAGDVVSQSPKPGVSQKEGSTITVVLASGKPNVTVPSLAGMTCAQAAVAPDVGALQFGVQHGRDLQRHRAAPVSWCCGRSTRPRIPRRLRMAPPSPWSPQWATRRSACRTSRTVTRSTRPRPR